MTPQELEQRIRQGIPIAAHMDFRVLELSANAITVKGGGAENINVHGTAFAGSLYAICTLSVWGLVNSRLPRDAALVMAEGKISYRRPVVGDIVASCQIDGDEFERFLKDLSAKGRARLEAVSTVGVEQGLAAEFTGQLHARLG